MPSDDSRVLELVAGDNQKFTMHMYDDRDLKESLAGATKARLVIRREPNAATAVLDISTEAPGSELTFDVANSLINAQMTAAQANALLVGTHVAELVVEFGTTKKHSDRFHARVLKAIAPNLT